MKRIPSDELQFGWLALITLCTGYMIGSWAMPDFLCNLPRSEPWVVCAFDFGAQRRKA